MFWIRRAAQINPLYHQAAGEPVLAEIDALLTKGAADLKLSDRDNLRLAVLATMLGWCEEQLNQRLQMLAPKKG